MSEHPYPGLRPFHRDETTIFFGRETQADQLLEKLGHNHFLAVVGPSGYGKSSLVRTGLLAGLETGFLSDAGARWAIAEMRTGDQPFARLGEALLAEPAFRKAYAAAFDDADVGQASAFLEASLRRGPESLRELLDENPLPDGTRLLVLADQFEEIFRFGQSSAEAAAFVALLLKASQDRRIYVVLTMRSDFMGHCARYQGLPEAINTSLFLTPRLDHEQLTEAIGAPARVFGGQVEPALVARLLNDAGDDPDQLPLLQHTLMRLWDAAGDHAITLDGYLRLGGLKHALSDHAEEAYEELGDKQRTIAETMFRALTERGGGQRDTRRPVTVATIAKIAGVETAEVADVVEVFRRHGRNFLTPTVGMALKPETILDISHESLIRQWKTLNEWVASEAESAEIYTRLERDARDWRDGVGGLRTAPRLDVELQWQEDESPTEPWARRYGGDFQLALDFLTTSERQRRQDEERQQQKIEEERRREEDQRQGELEAAQKLAAERQNVAKRLGRLAVALAVVVLLAAAAGTFAWIQQEDAEAAREQAEASEKRRASELFESQLVRASLLADGEDYAAAKVVLARTRKLDDKVAPGRRRARDFLARFAKTLSGAARQVYEGVGALLYSVAVSPDGRLLAAVGNGGTVVLFDVESGAIRQQLEGHHDDVYDVVIDPDGEWFATGDKDGKIIRWSLPLADSPAERLQAWEAPAGVWALAVSPDGQMLASGGQDNVIILWNVATGQLLRRLDEHTGTISEGGGLAFSPSGERLASVSYDGTARLWDVAKGQSLMVFKGHKGVVAGVTFSPDGRRIVTSGQDKRLILWDVESGRLLRVFTGHENNVFSAAIVARHALSETDRQPEESLLLVSASADRTLRVWDLTSGVTLQVLQGHTNGALDIAIHTPRATGSGLQIFSAGRDGTVRRWILAPLPHQRLLDLPGPAESSAISPNGRRVAVGFQDGSLRLYALPAGDLLAEAEGAHDGTVARLSFSANGSLLASASHDFTAKLWAVAPDGGLTPRQTFRGHKEFVQGLAFSPDGRTLATASYDGRVGLFAIGTEAEPRFIDAHAAEVNSVAFNNKGTFLLSAGGDQTTRLWDLTADPPTLYKDFPMAQSSVYWATFSPDGRSMARVGRTVTEIYDTDDGSLRHQLVGHESTVFRAIFSPDGGLLATASSDATVRLWDLDTGGELFTLSLPAEKYPHGPLWDFDFRCTPAGCWLAVPLTRGKLALYDLGPYAD